MQRNEARASSASNDVKLHFLDYWRVIRVRMGIVLLSFLLVLITAAVTTYFLPRKYRATARVELRRENSEYTPFNTGTNTATEAGFAPTQMEIIQSPNVLYQVIESLQLQKRWAGDNGPLSREEAYSKLRNMLFLKVARQTEIVDVTITSTDARESSELANAVVDAYQTKRRDVSQVATDLSISAISKELDAQQKKVDDLNKRVLDMKGQHPEIRDTTVDVLPTEDPRKAEIDTKQASVDTLSATVAGLQTQLEKIEKLKGDELMRALPTLDINDPVVMKIFPQYNDALASEASMLQSGLGPNHPRLVALRATISTLLQQLNDQIDSIKRSLSIRLDIAKKTLETNQAQLDKMRAEQHQIEVVSAAYYQLKDEWIKEKGLLTAAEQRENAKKTDAVVPQPAVRTWQVAETPTSPSSPIVWLNLTLGGIVGVIVGISLAFFIEYLDTSVKTMSDVETLLGVPVLAIIPKDIRLLHKQPSDIPDAEAYRILRTNIEFNRKSADANTISMVSGGPGEGKSTTLSNLAYTCAQGGYSVLIVDADLRRPTQHKLFSIDNNVGLTNYLTTNTALEDVILPTGIENLSLLPSGILPADAVGILNSQRMSDMIAELKTRFDIIFFDSPPILGVSDGAVLASEVDQSIIIVQHRRFPRAMLQRVKLAVTNVGGTVLGVVLNNVDLRHDPNYAYYTSYYDYYSERPKEEKRRAPAEPVATNGSAAPSATRESRNDTEY